MTLPTIAQLRDIPGVDSARKAVRILIALRYLPHEDAMRKADRLIDGHGVEGLYIGGHETDGGIRMCPTFSYVNMGDTYVATLVRDHSAGRYLVASWGDCFEEREPSVIAEAWSDHGADDFRRYLANLGTHSREFFAPFSDDALWSVWLQLAENCDSAITESDGVYFPFTDSRATWKDARRALLGRRTR